MLPALAVQNVWPGDASGDGPDLTQGAGALVPTGAHTRARLRPAHRHSGALTDLGFRSDGHGAARAGDGSMSRLPRRCIRRCAQTTKASAERRIDARAREREAASEMRAIGRARGADAVLVHLLDAADHEVRRRSPPPPPHGALLDDFTK